jgi:hypothetical protein
MPLQPVRAASEIAAAQIALCLMLIIFYLLEVDENLKSDKCRLTGHAINPPSPE